MEIRSLEGIDFDTLFQAFSKAFADYDFQISAGELQAMMKRRGFDPTLSFAAFAGGEMVAFTLNCIGDHDGKRMAYDTGTGTRKEYRGQGLATRIFEYAIPHLKEADISHYLLEVLQHNTKAIAVYERIGFKVSREFNYFVWQNEQLENEVKDTDDPYVIDRFERSAYENIPAFWDFQPSWQNSFESIHRASEDFIDLGVFSDKKLIGYCIFEPGSGDITQLAVDKAHRRKGIGSLLLEEVRKLNRNARTKLINADVSCVSMPCFLKAKNIGIAGKQLEMIKEI